MRNQLRLYSGLVLFTFVTGHFINHSLGLISIEVAEAATQMFIDPWRTMPGTVILGGAAMIHAGCAIWSLWVRRSLRLPAWELMQMVLGFAAPLLLATHVAATRGLSEVSSYNGGYESVIAALWVGDPLKGVIQAIALIVVWSHGCLGLHTWLRLKPTYLRLQSWAFGLAVALPVFAMAGFIAMGNEVLARSADPKWLGFLIAKTGFERWMVDFISTTEDSIRLAVIAALASVILVQAVAIMKRRMERKPKLRYAPGDRSAKLVPGATLLESIRAAGIPHASICGGRGRCSTCRVRIGRGLEGLPEPSETERKVLSRHTTSNAVRLACQIRPSEDIEIAALVSPDVTPVQLARSPDYMQGREMSVAFLFVDLRGSTKLCEDRLPFDVVFILNQFFAELSKALEETDGLYAQFNGDGLMAIYGLNSNPETAARQSLLGAQAMFRRIEGLNARLSEELAEPLRIGIGIHSGEAIVGSMGPPATPIVSALGDTVNIAARLESQTKEFGVPLVVSAAVVEKSAVDLSAFARHTVPVKGRDNHVEVFAVDAPQDIKIATAVDA